MIAPFHGNSSASSSNVFPSFPVPAVRAGHNGPRRLILSSATCAWPQADQQQEIGRGERGVVESLERALAQGMELCADGGELVTAETAIAVEASSRSGKRAARTMMGLPITGTFQ
jgi:hypothetical protein